MQPNDITEAEQALALFSSTTILSEGTKNKTADELDIYNDKIAQIISLRNHQIW
jgi:hypothetical protein